MRPDDFVPFPERPARRLMLAVTGRLKRPRVVRGGFDVERWTRAWARRWWVVDAATADDARDAIARYDAKCDRVGLGVPVDAMAYGIVASGRNASGPTPPRAPTAAGGNTR